MNQLRALFSGALVLAFVVIGAAGIAWAVGAQYDQTADENYTVTNESITVDYGNATAVDPPTKASSFDASVTVRNSAGDTLTEGQDYDWDPDDGAVTWYDTPDTTDGETASIDYGYSGPSQTARTIFAAVALPIRVVFPVSVFVVVGMSVVGLAVGIYRVYRRLGRSHGGGSFTTRR